MKVALSYAAVLIAFAASSSLAQPQTPIIAPHYTKHVGGNGDLYVRARGPRLTIYVDAGGIPRGGDTAPDCGFIASGVISGDTLQATITAYPDGDWKPWQTVPKDAAADPGQLATFTFSKNGVDLKSADVASMCGDHSGVFGHYTRSAH